MEDTQAEEVIETRTVEFNSDESQALIQIIDIALKATGLQNAKVCTMLSDKIVEAFK
jgi:hypothetical protein